ncbi:endolytic transglycosylase MltG, partial [Candidatus Berkelbacteria bacterium]|nr:endolytic transglycosylase MltG [Candidatus Berkelbacteria bacterium]
REAKADSERPIIAGIFMNRLQASLRLQADPTVAYGRDTGLNRQRPMADWRLWDPVTPRELKVDHGWNTYTRDGLPMTPISNPGLSSLRAAISPAPHQLFYFFHTTDGEFVPSATLKEHRLKLKQ